MPWLCDRDIQADQHLRPHRYEQGSKSTRLLTDRGRLGSGREDVLVVDGRVEQTLIEKFADLDAGWMIS